MVAFHRPYKRIGVEKGDERRVAGVDHKGRAVPETARDRDGPTAPVKEKEMPAPERVRGGGMDLGV